MTQTANRFGNGASRIGVALAAQCLRKAIAQANSGFPEQRLSDRMCGFRADTRGGIAEMLCNRVRQLGALESAQRAYGQPSQLGFGCARGLEDDGQLRRRTRTSILRSKESFPLRRVRAQRIARLLSDRYLRSADYRQENQTELP